MTLSGGTRRCIEAARSGRSNRFVAFLRLVRAPNALLAAAGVILGGRWVGASWGDRRVWLAAGAAVCLGAVANAFNDYVDLDIDATAHPSRPLPAGELSPRFALGTVVVAALVALGLSVAAVPALGALSAGVIGLMLAYGSIKQRSGLAANVVVAILGSLPFVYGAWAAGHAGPGVRLAFVAAPLQFAREVAKDIDDVEGDRARRRTLPVAIGVGMSRVMVYGATLLFLEQWILFAGPLASVPAAACCVAGVIYITRGRRHGAAVAYKAAMAVAVLTLLAVSPGPH